MFWKNSPLLRKISRPKVFHFWISSKKWDQSNFWSVVPGTVAWIAVKFGPFQWSMLLFFLWPVHSPRPLALDWNVSVYTILSSDTANELHSYVFHAFLRLDDRLSSCSEPGNTAYISKSVPKFQLWKVQNFGDCRSFERDSLWFASFEECITKPYF